MANVVSYDNRGDNRNGVGTSGRKIIVRTFPIAITVCVAALAYGSAAAQTQMELNETAANDSKKADEALNAAYKAAMAALSGPQQTALKETQRAWIDYRDKAAKAQAALYEGGSIQPMIFSDTLARLTKERAAQLAAMLPDAVRKRAAALPDAAAAEDRRQQADALLNKVYKAYMKDAGDPAGPLMKEAERAWITFRDLCIKSEQTLFDPSKAAAAGALSAAEMIETRTVWLKEMFIEGYDDDPAPATTPRS